MRLQSKGLKILAVLLLLIFSALMCSSHQIMWGVETLSDPDIINQLARVESYLKGQSGITEYPGLVGLEQVYPPGFIYLLTTVTAIINLNTIFHELLVLKIFFAVFTTFLLFVLGREVSYSFGLASALFSVISFGFVSSFKYDYVYMVANQNFFGTGTLSAVLFLLSLFCIIKIIKSSGENTFFYSLALLTFFTLEGLQHISPYIGKMFLLTIFISILFFVYRHDNISFSKKYLEIIIPLFSSIPLIYLLHFRNIVENINEYNVHYFPHYTQPFLDFLGYMSIMLLLLAFALFYLMRFFRSPKSLTLLPIISAKKKYFIVCFLAIYYLILVSFGSLGLIDEITNNTVGGLFPLIVSFNLHNIKVIPFEVLGFFCFFLALCGILYMLNAKNEFLRFYGFMFLTFFLVYLSLIFPFQFGLRKDLDGVGFLFPFVLASSACGLHSIISFFRMKVETKNGTRLFSLHSVISRFLKYTPRKQILFLVIVLFLLVPNLTYQINLQPAVHPDMSESSMIFTNLKTIHYQHCSSTLRDYLDNKITKDQYLLAPIKTLKVIHITTSHKGTVYDGEWLIKNRYLFNQLRGALVDPDYLKKYTSTYNINYIVIGEADVKEYNFNTFRYDLNPTLKKVYSNGAKERIYYVDNR